MTDKERTLLKEERSGNEIMMGKLEKENNRLSEVLKDLEIGKEAILENIKRVENRISQNDELSCRLFEENAKITQQLKEENPTITVAERDFLKSINKVMGTYFNYVARDMNGNAFLYDEKPHKGTVIMNEWSIETVGGNPDRWLNVGKTILPFITYDDEEPWSFEELLKLPVKEKK